MREFLKYCKQSLQELVKIINLFCDTGSSLPRYDKICNKLKIKCFNPLWQKEQIELLEDLIKNKFKVIITGVFAYPLNEKWLGRRIDKKFIEEMRMLSEKYKINPAGEGGEFESFVLNCPLFKKRLKVKGFHDYGDGNSWRREVELG